MDAKFGRFLRRIYISWMFGTTVLDGFFWFWRERVKPLQFYTKPLSATFIIDEKKLLFWKKMFSSTNVLFQLFLACYMLDV